MRYLLVIAHGSRRAESNDDFAGIAKRLGEHTDNPCDATRWAFLEMAQPSISDAVDQCAAEGALEVVVLPYFLSPGNHVARDIPRLLDRKRAEYPEIRFTVLDHFGKSQVVVDWLLQHVKEHRGK